MKQFIKKTKQKHFTAWCIKTEKKLPDIHKEGFSKVWPEIQNTNDVIRGAYVAHWSMVMGGDINEISMPVTIGTLTYLQLAAHHINREDLVEVLNSMIANIPRIRHEIEGGMLSEEE
tara:strand:- start:9977 stop:10327 length:351 start_codon:yes stop_codon:yes gene_type:complete